MKRKRAQQPNPLYRAKSCTGKKKYNTKLEAITAKNIQQEYGEPMDEVYPYKCSFCNRWHLGHEIIV